MEAVFLKIVNMSLTASWLVLAVLLIRFVFRKAPKWIFCLLWGLVAIRLVCPFSIESGLSLIPSSEPLPEEIIYTATPNIESGISAVDKVVNPILSESLTTDGLASANQTQIWSFLLAHLWIIGVGIMVLYAIVSYLLLKRRMQTATLYRENMKQSELVDSPFVLGLFRPVIYLPYNIDEEDLEYVIAHEQAHIKRKDHLWKPAGFLLLCVYWFNPIIWAAYIFLCRDIEAACDEKVIKEMEKDGLRAYSTALLNCSVHRRRIMACPIAFGEVGVKERVKNVMSYKKPAFWIVLMAAAVSVIAGICFLTNPLNDKNTKLMGAEYLIEEVLYAVTVGDEVSTEPPHMYGITPDYRLYYQNGVNEERVLLGAMEPYNLTKPELYHYMPVDEMRKNANVSQITDSYILRVENDNFYLVFQTKSGDTYLGYGWEDISERDQGASDDTRLRRLYHLENRFVKNTMYGDYFNYFLKNLLGKNADTFAYQISDDFKGYAIIGFMANGTQQSDMTDMGFAVFQMDSKGGYSLLDYHVYEDAAISDNGIYYCDHAAIMDVEGEMTADKTYDVILSCNANLQRIERTYIYDEDENSLDHSKKSVKNCDDDIAYEMILFGWEMEEKALRVEQRYYDKNGNEMMDTVMKIEGHSQTTGKQLTLDEVIRLSEKGEELSWEDFEDYSHFVTGSGLYIRKYEIDDRFTLSIGGNYPYDDPGKPKEPYYDSPLYIYLSVEGVVEHRIDIRYEDAASFIEKYKTDPLEDVIYNLVLEKNEPEIPDGQYHAANFLTLGTETRSGTPLEGQTNHMEQVTVYGLVLHEVFQVDEYYQSMENTGETHIAAALTFNITDGKYELSEYWTPRLGVNYARDIKDKFPDELEKEVLNPEKYLTAQKQRCYEQVLLNSAVYEGEMLEELLGVIASSAALSSNPTDYIDAHSAEFQEITYYGAYALRYFFYEFLEGNGAGLKGHIMARACQVIGTGYGEAVLFEQEEPETGEEWFEALKANAEQLKNQYSYEELKEHYYVSWLLLNILEGYY